MGLLKLYFLLICFSAVYATTDSPWDKLPSDCGRTRYMNTRIISGSRAKVGQFPYIVRLGLHEYPRQRIDFICGGTLISRYYVISAAHCEEKVTIVRAGENILSSEVDCDGNKNCAPPHQDILVKKHIFGDFCRTTYINDISLIELQTPVQFNEYVQPACLPRQPFQFDDIYQKPILISGWGSVRSSSSTPPNNLMFVYNEVIEHRECLVINAVPLIDSQICMGVRGLVRGNGPCSGDSGGPAVRQLTVDGENRIYLVGIVSAGYALCEYGPKIFTNVSHFLDFILDNIEKK